jgi:signal peptidase I
MLRPMSKRKPWVAGMLSLLTPGLGHLYVGQPRKAAIVYLLVLFSYFGFAGLAMYGRVPNTVNMAGSLLILVFLLCVVVYMLIDGRHIARMEAGSYRLKFYNKWYLYGAIVLMTGVVGEQLTEIYQLSMLQFSTASVGSRPNPQTGQFLMVENISYHFTNPRRGEIVVFDSSDETKEMVKRVVGLPGEKLQIRDKRVWINDQPLQEGYAQYADPVFYPADMQPRDNLGPLQIPPEMYFVLGDNRDDSLDSRFFGSISRTKIKGKGRTIALSFDLR